MYICISCLIVWPMLHIRFRTGYSGSYIILIINSIIIIIITILCNAMLCYTIRYYTILYCTILYYTITILYYTILYYTTLHYHIHIHIHQVLGLLLGRQREALRRNPVGLDDGVAELLLEWWWW